MSEPPDHLQLEAKLKELNDLICTSFSVCEFSKARDYAGQALVICRELGDQDRVANQLTNLAQAYLGLNDLSRAVIYYEQTLTVYRQIGDHHREAALLNVLGNFQIHFTYYAQAIKYFEQGVKLYQQLDNQEGEVISLDGLSIAYAAMNDYQHTLACYQRVREIYLAMGSVDKITGVDNAIAVLQDLIR